ncbi:N-acetylmuramoyl-L-alanine amidase [Macrococcoides caseolyticum]|uniref:N-acetylmuramoyl-L-alanine amidase n=1 Tax=Macrococcoides caseolyticum TaxID=69966 RepID=UPI001E54528B|nr:N-acetylmuramoyl-L-alanine amidase [Macrococcus caseolyticus]
MAYKIINSWLPASKYSLKAPFAMNPEYITVHNTGNTASAREEAAYHNSNNSETSYHVVIDENEVHQLIPFSRNAWHSGDGRGNGNMKSIGIEIARSMDNGYSGPKSQRYMQAEENAALYIAHVMHERGWDMSRLKRHYDWSGKDCPHKMHATGTYQQFRDKVQKHLVALNSGKQTQTGTTNKPVQKAPAKQPAKAKGCKRIKAWSKTPHYKGTIQYTASLRQRAGSDFSNYTFNKEIGTLKKGETVYIFEEIQDAEGNIWCRTYSPSNNGWVHKHTIK